MISVLAYSVHIVKKHSEELSNKSKLDAGCKINKKKY